MFFHNNKAKLILFSSFKLTWNAEEESVVPSARENKKIAWGTEAIFVLKKKTNPNHPKNPTIF